MGVAYLFAYDSVYDLWAFEAELAAPVASLSGYFGYSVAVDAVDGNTVVVGAPFLTIGSNYSQGAAYVFVPGGYTWIQQATLTASNGAASDDFGYSVAVDGSTAVVGNIHKMVGSNVNQGAAYPFSYSATAVSFSPASLSFGNQVINTTSVAKTVMLTNTGATSVTISSITTSGDFAILSQTCGSSLAVGAKCNVKVTFTPTVLGKLTGALTLTDNAPNSPQTVALSGTGVLPATLTPANATYAAQAVATTSAPKTFTLSNNQTVALTGIVISTTGDFSVSATTCTTSLIAKGKCTISVTFTPTVTGTRTGKLSVSNSASNSPQTATLSGTGVLRQR